MEHPYIPAVPTTLKTSKGYIDLRSRLEAMFLAEIDKKGINWFYEPERIGRENYLVDFHLPELGVWVEVKGVLRANDEMQLPQVGKY
jgi:hypothetical protein